MAERLPFPHGSSEESALMCGPGLSANQPQTSYLPRTSAGQRSPGPGGAAKGWCHPGGGESSRKQRRRRDGTEQSTTEKGKDETGKGQKPRHSGFHARKAKLPRGTTQRMKLLADGDAEPRQMPPARLSCPTGTLRVGPRERDTAGHPSPGTQPPFWGGHSPAHPVLRLSSTSGADTLSRRA